MFRSKYIRMAMLLIAVLAVALVLAAQQFYQLEKQACLDTLADHTEKLAREIAQDFNDQQREMRFWVWAVTHGELSDVRGTAEFLASYQQKASGIMRLELLLPGDRLLGADGEIRDVRGTLSFAEEAALGAHISERSQDVLAGGAMVLRQMVPLRGEDGQTAALLCGVIALDELARRYEATAFGSAAQIYVIDGATGDFLVDTWHDTLGNVADLRERQSQEGYSREKTSADMSAGRRGDAVFRSEQAGEYFYAHYTPAGIGEWLVMLSVPESVAFAQESRAMRIIGALSLFMLAAFAVYFFWMLVSVRREKYETENQLSRVQYMFEVGKLLFNGHIEPQRIEQALCAVAQAMHAQRAFLLIVEGEHIPRRYVWSKLPEQCGAKTEDLSVGSAFFSSFLKEGKNVIFYEMNDLYATYPGSRRMGEAQGVHNLIMTAVTEDDGTITGLLGVCDMKHHWQEADQLECVSLTFAMVLRNLRVYEMMKRTSLIDALTGLYNRNSYHAALAKMREMQLDSAACVYMDANGLHEINNHLGHGAGDEMLCFIADEIRQKFGGQNAYRIGGDEFVIICLNQSRQEVWDKVEAIRQATQARRYFLSVGIEWREEDFDFDAIIQAAESKMQQDKRRYYQQDNDREIRQMNQQLETILTEKQDAEAFLSTIADKFQGVYFVSLSRNDVRHVFITAYFAEALERTAGCFAEALKCYAAEQVAPEYAQRFAAFCRYDAIEKQLQAKDGPSFCYQETDGSWLQLQVFKRPEYTSAARETLWVFENIAPAEQGGQEK